MANQLQQNGSQGQYIPIFTDRFFLGYVTNRNKLRSPLGAYYSKFITSNDALIDGTNIEVSNRLTLIRRPGNTAGLTSFLFNGNIPDVPDNFYSFHETTGVVRIFVDTPSAVYLWTSTAFIPIFTKAAGAGEGFFQGIGTTLYYSDLVESFQWSDSGITAGVAAPGNSTSPITATALTSNVATITAINSFVAGQTVVITGTTSTGGIFNGTFLIIGATATTFTFALTHGNVGSGADTGFATATFNFGIAAPTVAPKLTITQTGVSASSWQASTWYSTMGILIDTTNNIAMQLVSVNIDGSNPTSQYGLSGNGQPGWNQTPGGTTTDNSITWTNCGPIGSWKASTTFSGFSSEGGGGSVPAMIYDPASGGFYANSYAVSKVSGAVKPPFNGVLYQNYFDGTCNWVCYANAFSGASPNVFKWRPAHVYPTIPPFSPATLPDGFIVEPYAPPAPGIGYPTNQTVYAQISGGGTSSATPNAPWGASGVPTGVTANDNQLQWASLGSSIWAATTTYTAWSSPNNFNFNCVVDTANCLQVCNTSGVSGASAPWIVWQASHAYLAGATITDTNGFIQIVTTAGTSGTPSHPSWNTTIGGTTTDNGVTWTNNGYAYGSVTIDGGVKWTNVGLKTNAVWTANQSYYLPKAGFNLPNSFDKYGGAEIVDSNSSLEFVVVTGVSKSGAHPSWSVTLFGFTIDNSQVVWINDGPQLTGGISWTKGYTYAFAYKSRATTDRFLSTTTAPHGLGDAFNAGNNPLTGNPTILPAPTGGGNGSVSSASPSSTFANNNAGAIINISGLGSTDPQVDTIEIYRTADGGTTLFLLTDIVAPPPIGGVAQPWSFNDEIPDTPTATSDGLQTLTIAPTNGFNNPPQLGFINLVQHFGRIFGSVGSTVFSSEGPLVGGAGQPAGNGFTAFSSGQFWSFPSPVVRIVPTSVGLFVFTTSDLFIISGGPSVTTLFQNILIPGLGLSSYNALAINGSIINLLTADNQCVSLDPNMGVSEVGVAIGDKINAIDPTLAYLAHLTQGSNDKALFVANGSTGWYRCNLNQSPDSSISGPVWSPFAGIIGGVKAIAALEYTPGKHALVLGGTASNQPILVRDSKFLTFSDNSTAYYAWGTIGSIVLANPGELAELGFITADFIKVGTSPNVLTLLDEISDSYMNITAASLSGGNVTYTYTLGSGIQPVVGMGITVTGMATSGNNGTFVVTGGNLTTTFIVANASGHTEAGQVAIGSQFDPLGGYHGTTGIPPQDSPMVFGLTLAPNSVFANRYYFLQSINGTSPQASCCRHLQIKVDFGATDTVQNEILSLTIWGKHWSEQYA